MLSKLTITAAPPCGGTSPRGHAARLVRVTAVLVAAIAIGAPDARAWEPQTTHAGLAEQAALA